MFVLVSCTRARAVETVTPDTFCRTFTFAQRAVTIHHHTINMRRCAHITSHNYNYRVFVCVCVMLIESRAYRLRSTTSRNTIMIISP